MLTQTLRLAEAKVTYRRSEAFEELARSIRTRGRAAALNDPALSAIEIDYFRALAHRNHLAAELAALNSEGIPDGSAACARWAAHQLASAELATRRAQTSGVAYHNAIVQREIAAALRALGKAQRAMLTLERLLGGSP